MPAMSEAARSDLYNGLSEVLGPDRAEILMAQLHRTDPADAATKSDIAEVKSDFAELRSDFAELRSEFTDLRTEVREGLAAVNQRLDRLFLALLVGMFGVVAAFIGVVLRIP